MADSNRYSPPQAEVSDITVEAESFQPVKLWSTQGRIGRLRYLAYSIGATFVFAFFVGLLTAIIGKPVVGVVMILAYIPLMLFTLLIAIQRSHDMNWSGWTILLAIIPFVGLIWIFKAGTQGRNDYGDPPPPNTLVVKILGALFPIVMLIGILAAIALPAYQSYVKRAQAAQHSN
ncbi:MAG TPA: DUF805 domain-containing protein [Steroidobacteraceae bacterium]|nr:DUF805 domain-containing protein [Steroidobacteraceae bacterium]